MLTTNVYNTYYPSYVLHHHYSVFSPLVKKISLVKEMKDFVNKAKKNQVTGAFLHETRRIDFN